mmetsp:Transcript_40774/g.95663  ORF Transcript_40774/g.95663 Transcript_40774/m.95663 type:complete len:162 (-) Transcript_40774:104-589(-)
MSTVRTSKDDNMEENELKFPKLFIGGLHSSILDIHLTKLFSTYGNVSRAVVISGTDDHTGTKRPKGYGFVEMESIQEANNAMKAIDGRKLLGRELVVRPARAGGTARHSSATAVTRLGDDNMERKRKADEQYYPQNIRKQKKDIEAKILAIKNAISKRTRK